MIELSLSSKKLSNIDLDNVEKHIGGKPVHLCFEYDALGRRTTKISVWGRSIFHRVTRFLWDGIPEEGEVVLSKSEKTSRHRYE